MVAVAACGSKKEPTPQGGSAAGSGSATAVVVAPAPDAASADAAVVAVDAAEAAAAPSGKTGIEVVEIEGFKKRDDLGEKAHMWLEWIETHFEECTIDEKVEPVTTTVTITFKKDGGITFDMPKVPDALAACVKKKIETPYLGYEPTPPPSLGKTTLRVKIKLVDKTAAAGSAT